jgi:hypothetical protein
VRVVALDRYDRAVATLDTVILVGHSRALQKNEYIVGRAELTLPPGKWSYRTALEAGENTGVVLPRDSVRVGTTDPRFLSLSDIALGTPGRSVPWHTDQGDTVFMAPSELFRRGSDVGLYYEVTGAVPGEKYRHTVTVFNAKDRAGSTALVSLFFDEAAAGEVIRSRRLVRLNQLKSGNYIVEVNVSGSDGSSQKRRRAIRLIDK